MKWQEMGTILGVVTALSVTVGGVFAGLEYTGLRPVVLKEFAELQLQVQSNSQTLALQRWQWLNEKRRIQGLSIIEQIEYCKLSRLLGIRGEGCA